MIFFRIHTKKKWNYKREKSLKLAPRLHFRCEDTACVCETGWRGHRCEEQDCDPRCSLHGQCKNGTCLCVAGWNGLHCTLEGCPRGCSNHGSCKADFRGMYYFNCFNLTSLFCIFSWNWISRKKFQFFLDENEIFHMWRIHMWNWFHRKNPFRFHEYFNFTSFFAGEWSCHCHQGWEGPDCSVRLETRCNDGYDDDQGKNKSENFCIENYSKAWPFYLVIFL